MTNSIWLSVVLIESGPEEEKSERRGREGRESTSQTTEAQQLELLHKIFSCI